MSRTVTLKKDMTVLFQGDSITDAGRNGPTPGGLGRGYVYMICSMLGSVFPELNINFINRGISGNRVRDLKARWDDDCLALKPDLVSVMIGVNDTWRRFDRNDPTAPEQFRDDYHRILTETRDNGNPILVLCEPFLLPCPPDRIAWREDIDAKIAVVRDLAREFKAILVPNDGVFAAASASTGPDYWAGDGVHPAPAGHALLARTWMSAVVGLSIENRRS